MIKEVEDLKCRGDFSFRVVAGRAPIAKVEERVIQPVFGSQTISTKLCYLLMEDEVGTLGLYGMGGVGKTTLLSQINNNFVDTVNDFEVMIWVVVSKDLQVESIQETILRRLGRWDEEWKHKTDEEKASEIYRMLKDKRYMLLLDDIWSKVDIQKIGVPLPTRKNKCKLVFTTRSKEVCRQMQFGELPQLEIEVECLSWDDAWDLFQKKVGDRTLQSHPETPELARLIAQKCHGLPLALNVIGETMASRMSREEWHHAVGVLTSFAAEFSGMEEKVLHMLKFSYDSLKDDKLRECLLYCALFPEDYEIEKEVLVEYWICEGIIAGNDEDRGRAKNHGHEIIGSLVRACLMMESEHREYVKMHDMVREMALWIATDLGRNQERFIVKAGAKLNHFPNVENWSAVHKMSLMENQIGRISLTPDTDSITKLVTLFLHNNKLVNISGQFFTSMSELKVLDLSSNENLIQLPEQISNLVSLRYLNLSRTGIEMLPAGIRYLRKLIHLNLEYTHNLISVVGISNLWSLQVLRLFESNILLSNGLVEELQFLEHLKLLTLTLKDATVMEQLLNIHSLVNFTQKLSLIKCTPKSLRVSLFAVSSNLSDHEIPERAIDWLGNETGTITQPQNMTTPNNSMCFRNLTRIDIVNCEGLKELTWLIYAPNLARLRVEMSFQIEEIINREKVMEIEKGKEEPKSTNMPFLKLESLSLLFLYALKSIYWSPLPFPALENLKILACPKLMQLPLDSESAKGRDLVIDAYGEWLQRLQWEDEATKNRFCPL